jgi:AraC-type transcriptional regulator
MVSCVFAGKSSRTRCLILLLSGAETGWLNRVVPLDELRALLARHARPDGTTAVDGMLISQTERPNAPSASMSGTVLALIAQGAKRIALDDRVHEYRAGQYLVASVDLPVTGHFVEASPRRPALGFGLALRPAAVAEVLLQASPGDLPRGGGATPPGIAVSDASDELLDAVVRLVRLLDHPHDITVLAPLVEREILWRVITGEQGATVRELGLADSGLAHIARAVRWIRDHHAEAFRVEEVFDGGHERVGVLPQLPGRHGDEPDPVPEANPATGSPAAVGHPPGRRHRSRPQRRL